MASSKEEIALRLGIDSKAVKTGLSSAGEQIKKFASGVKVQFAAAFSFGAVIAQVKSTIDYVERLSNTAGSLSVSSSFLQDVNNIGTAAGKSQEKMERLLTLFAKGLTPGQDLETEFYKFLDDLAATKDPAEKLAKAFDRVGKSGKEMLDIARDGSEAFKELAKTFSKLSEDDIAAINKLDSTLDSFWNKFQIKIGKAIASTQKFFEALSGGKPMSKQWPTMQEALDVYKKEAEDAKKTADAAKALFEGQVPGILQGPLQPDQDPRYGNRQFSFAQPRMVAAKTGTAAVEDYMSKIKAGQDAYKAKTDYSQFGKAIVEAQVESSAKFVQKVAIVEIKE